MQLTVEAAKRIDQLPRYLQKEFPTVPLAVIEHDVDTRVRVLITDAHFDDYVPLLAHKAVRQHLRDPGWRVSLSEEYERLAS